MYCGFDNSLFFPRKEFYKTSGLCCHHSSESKTRKSWNGDMRLPLHDKRWYQTRFETSVSHGSPVLLQYFKVDFEGDKRLCGISGWYHFWIFPAAYQLTTTEVKVTFLFIILNLLSFSFLYCSSADEKFRWNNQGNICLLKALCALFFSILVLHNADCADCGHGHCKIPHHAPIICRCNPLLRWLCV